MSVAITKTLRYLKTNIIHSPKNSVLTFFRTSKCRYRTKFEPYPTKYGGKSIVTVMPGAGIGPEIMECTLQVLESANAPLTYEIITLSPHGDRREFENALISIRRNKISLKANIEMTNNDPMNAPRNSRIRKALDTFVYFVRLTSLPSLFQKFGTLNLTLIRQNTEGEYLMLEHEPNPQTVEFLKVVTVHNTQRLAEFALSYALFHKKTRMTVAHSGSVQDSTESIFIKAVLDISVKYPEIKLNIIRVGVLICDIVKNPTHYDVILATNLNGSMLVNFLTGMLGSPALSAGVNLSPDGIAMFEPGVRNRGLSLVGRGIANPLAMIMSAVNMLDYLRYEYTADIIRKSVYSTLFDDRIRTPDLGGTATSQVFTESIIQNVKKNLQEEWPANKMMTLFPKMKDFCPMRSDFFSTPFSDRNKRRYSRP